MQGYRDQMLSEEMAPLVPPGLQGKEDVLFGNLHELFTFHSDIFLKDLENCISTTELVALCFVQRVSFFQLFLIGLNKIRLIFFVIWQTLPNPYTVSHILRGA